MTKQTPRRALLLLYVVMLPSVLASGLLTWKLLPKPRYLEHEATAYYHTCDGYTARNTSSYSLPCTRPRFVDARHFTEAVYY